VTQNKIAIKDYINRTDWCPS